MKRAHRRLHLWLWLIIAPVLAVTLFLALTHRQADPVTETLPPILSEEAS